MHAHPPMTESPIEGPVRFHAVDERVLDIPPLSRRGHLPEGIHDACFEEVLERFATNPARKALCHRLEDFLLLVIDTKNFSHATLGGDFVSVKAMPQDIELTLQTWEPFGLHAFRAMEAFVSLGLESIQEDYSVRLRFWFDGTPNGLVSFRDYFQDLLPENANALASRAKIKKGLVRIKL